MRGFAFVLLIPLLLPPGPPGLYAQEEEDDARWIENCQRHDDDGDRERFCDVVVESVDAPAATIAFDSGRNGGVIYRGWDHDRMEVHARIQAHADTDAEARELARSIRFEIGPSGGRAVGPAQGDDWAVVYHVYVPRQRNLEGTAHNGPLAAEGVQGRIRFETRNGPIDLRDVGGDVYARAQNGPISVELGGTTWQGEGLDAETRNGPISVSIPANYSAILETGTVNGPFDTEIPLQVRIEPGKTGRQFRAELGSGGPLVRVITTNGPVSIEAR
jgi:DUF4097 and DUF4098 domain-containing protein YvlB